MVALKKRLPSAPERSIVTQKYVSFLPKCECGIQDKASLSSTRVEAGTRNGFIVIEKNRGWHPQNCLNLLVASLESHGRQGGSFLNATFELSGGKGEFFWLRPLKILEEREDAS
jgi:hypothetical protein